ncbi:MAG: hypothetical protein WC758_02610 [Candidatus Woesearchaeota archaeon]|jgi:hypothetical protein
MAISIKTEKIEEGKIDDFSGTPTMESKITPLRTHFTVANIISVLVILVFLYLLVFEKNTPDYLIGFVGSIFGYYLARAPYDFFKR